MYIHHRLLPTLFLALLIVALPRTARPQHGCNDYPECCDLEELVFQNPYHTLDELILDLRHRWPRSGDFRIIQNWHEGDAPRAPHHQYGSACFFFAVSPTLESLGYARYQPCSHMDMSFVYWSGVFFSFEADVGFWGSPEQLMLDFATSDSRLYPYTQGVIGDLEAFPSFNPKEVLNCSEVFNAGEEYAFCDPLSTSTFPGWLHQIRGSTSSGQFAFECGGSNDAPCGAIWYLNNNGVYNGQESWGCNDARSIPVDTDERTYYRRMIKAFVDNDTPLLSLVALGRHWVPIIGYSELDHNGLPRKAILADPFLQRYWISHNLHKRASWRKEGYCSFSSIVPWNHYRDGGCSSDGWAKKLDGFLPPSLKLCQLRDVSCSDPYYGIEVVCEDNGNTVATFHAKPTDPFIEVDQDIVCDAVTLRYSDGVRLVESARAKRFRGPQSWQLLSAYNADDVLNPLLPYNTGHTRRSIVIWDDVWSNDYWLVAIGAPSPYTERRTEIELEFNDGTSKTIEISPSDTYEVRLYCRDHNGDLLDSWKSNADHEYFEDRSAVPHEQLQFFHELSDRTCDAMELVINIGEEQEIIDAELERWGYRRHLFGGSETEALVWWQWDLLSSWPPDNEEFIGDGLSGQTVRLVWSDSWPDGWWAVADDVGPNSDEDRKTRIILTLESGTERIIDLVPI